MRKMQIIWAVFFLEEGGRKERRIPRVKIANITFLTPNFSTLMFFYLRGLILIMLLLFRVHENN